MSHARREFLKTGAALAATAAVGGSLQAQDAAKSKTPAKPHSRPIGVSTYSFWQFRGERLGILRLHRQSRGNGLRRCGDPARSDERRINRRFQQASSGRPTRYGLALMGFSTHQGVRLPRT